MMLSLVLRLFLLATALAMVNGFAGRPTKSKYQRPFAVQRISPRQAAKKPQKKKKQHQPFVWKKAQIACMEAEKALITERGMQYVMGADESGNGCLAGPVIVATCVLLDPLGTEPIEGVFDSKNLEPEDRIRIYNIVKSQPERYAFTTAQALHTEIDASSVQAAAHKATAQCIDDLMEQHNFPPDMTYCILDGHRRPRVKTRQLKVRPWIKADTKVYTVALASIIARVEHDNYMKYAHELYPQYGFDRHRGYSNLDHIEAISIHGPSPIHRRSNRRLKNRSLEYAGKTIQETIEKAAKEAGYDGIAEGTKVFY